MPEPLSHQPHALHSPRTSLSDRLLRVLLPLPHYLLQPRSKFSDETLAAVLGVDRHLACYIHMYESEHDVTWILKMLQ